MKIKYLTFFLFPILFLFSRCSKVLDIAPDGNMQMEEVLVDPDKVEALLNSCYNKISQKGYEYYWLDNLVILSSDDGYTSDDGQGVISSFLYNDQNTAATHWMSFRAGGQTSDTDSYWTNSWQQIRLCSQFIDLIDRATVHRESDRARFKAEVRVLRAFFYMELIKWYGKVPVINETLGFDADFSTMTRSSVYDVAQFIIADCDAAISEPTLPWRIDNPSDAMRMTKAVAMALKTKAMLFAASPLHNEGNNYWEEAYTTAKNAVVQLKANGYQLFTQTTQPNIFGTGKAASLRQLVCQDADYSPTPRDKETIFQVRSGGHFIWHIGYIGSNMTNAFKCGTAPTQELIDAFETIDGKPILDLNKPYLDEFHLQPNYNTDNTLYDPNNPYANRDPRMAETALYNGSRFLWDGQIVTVETFTGGRHAPSFDVSNRSASRTGYYHSKLVTPGASGQNPINNSKWKYYRLGELLLDYAEAAAEAGHLNDARLAVNEVRVRSGMPELPSNLSQKDLILRVRNERRVELAWEEQRYFDLRRWQLPTGDLSETSKWFTAMVITKNQNGTFSYTRRNISSNPRGGWQNRDLLLPIPQSEASNLEAVTGETWQNPGW